MSANGERQDAAVIEWIKGQLEAHGRHVAGRGLIESGRLRAHHAWSLPGRLCISRVAAVHNQAQAYWVISGEVPTDEVDARVAPTAREAARHFALKWQMMAARVGDRRPTGDDGKPDAWTEVGDKLAQTAEALYAVTQDDGKWPAA
jgi:hypothetical protein